MTSMCAKSARANRERRKRAIRISVSVCPVGSSTPRDSRQDQRHHFNKITPVKRIDTGLDLRPQCFQFQRILSPSLLQHAKRVAHRFARILVLACFHNPLDEGVLLVSQNERCAFLVLSLLNLVLSLLKPAFGPLGASRGAAADLRTSIGRLVTDKRARKSDSGYWFGSALGFPT